MKKLMAERKYGPPWCAAPVRALSAEVALALIDS